MSLKNRCGGYRKISHVIYEESHMTSVNILGLLQVSDKARLGACSQDAQGGARVSPGSCGPAVHAGWTSRPAQLDYQSPETTCNAIVDHSGRAYLA